MNYRIDGEKLYIGTGELDWVGFYHPIVHAEYVGNMPDIKVITSVGEYILRDVDRPSNMRVLNVSGKTMQELSKERLESIKERLES